jgi:cytosine/adenosine deaminase-related metal-dependent hydrolase
MWLNNVNIIGSEGLQNIQIADGKIKCITTENKFSVKREEIKIEFKNAIAFPGLINSHDHLDFNLFPQIGNRIYNNYTEWGKDIHCQNKEAINGVLKIPKPLRIQWGLYKNLLNGITTVVNHGEKLHIPNPFIRALQDNHSLHSVQFERNWKLKLNNPFVKKQPYVIHVGEGTDEMAHQEINTLIKRNFFNKSLFTVHGVAMSPEQAENFVALIWCPASNYFLLNKTADIKNLKTKTSILFGTDSTLTASWNLWEHLRMARKIKMMTDAELFQTLTKNPAEKWRQKNIGSISINSNADVVIAKSYGNKGFNAFYSINPEDILLVLHKGKIRLIDEEIKNGCINDRTRISRFSKISINGRCKFIYGDLHGLIKDVRGYYPKVDFPVCLK